MSNRYGERKAFDISEVMNHRAPLTLRINPLKISREEVLQCTCSSSLNGRTDRWYLLITLHLEPESFKRRAIISLRPMSLEMDGLKSKTREVSLQHYKLKRSLATLFWITVQAQEAKVLQSLIFCRIEAKYLCMTQTRRHSPKLSYGWTEREYRMFNTIEIKVSWSSMLSARLTG